MSSCNYSSSSDWLCRDCGSLRSGHVRVHERDRGECGELPRDISGRASRQVLDRCRQQHACRVAPDDSDSPVAFVQTSCYVADVPLDASKTVGADDMHDATLSCHTD